MRPRFPAPWLPITVALAVCLPGGSGAAGLDDEQRDGYRLWLHNLETTVAARSARGDAEAIARFPFGVLTETESLPADTLSLLTVARELDALEARPRLLQEPGRKTTLSALVRARNHRNIAEYDTALTWYAEALRRDTTASFTRDVRPEAMAVAAAAGDSAVFAGRLAAAVSADSTGARRDELLLAYRFLIARGDTAGVDRLLAATDGGRPIAAGDVAFWRAFAQNWRGRWEESLAGLLDLLRTDGVSHGLTEAERTWVLTAIPDQLVLAGRLAEAEPLYRALAESDLPGAHAWGRCQAAALAFLAGRYLEAGTAFEELCGQREDFPWRQYACDMSELSDRMERLRNEGKAHGAASHFDR